MKAKQFAAIALLLLTGSSLFSQRITEHYQPAFVFSGHKIYIEMSEREALMALSSCCELTPPAMSDTDEQSSPQEAVAGHFILSKGQSSQPLLGAIYFSEGKVVHVSRELAPNVNTSNDDLIAFVRALKRALPKGSNSAVFTMQHESASNGESDVLTLVFPNGRGVELRIGTLDTSNTTNRRDFVSLNETLQPRR